MDDSGSLSGMHFSIFIILGLIIVAAAIVVLTSTPDKISGPVSDENCRVNESGMLIDPCVPLFKIINGTNDTFTIGERDWPFEPAPPINESQKYIEKALEPYGGLPKNAVLSSLEETAWGGTIDPSTWIETKHAEEWCANYHQYLYGEPVTGHGGSLAVCIVSEGKPDLIRKKWVSVEEVGMERIIPPSEAVNRLEKRDGRFNPPTKTLIYNYIPDGPFNLSIKTMEVRYFVSEDPANQTYLEPVWRISSFDTVRGMPFIFYIPAGYRPVKYTRSIRDIFGNQRNFSQIGGNLSSLNVSPSSYVAIGTSGPIGKDAAMKSVQEFIENTAANLTYHGRFRSVSDMCSGGYQGEYYKINTTDCEFRVDVFSGTMISARLHESCVRPGFSGKSEKRNITTAEARDLSDTFVQKKYPNFNEKHLVLSYGPDFNKDRDGDYFRISYSGDFGAISDSGVYMSVSSRDGLVTRYWITDDDLQYLCGGYEREIRIDE